MRPSSRGVVSAVVVEVNIPLQMHCQRSASTAPIVAVAAARIAVMDPMPDP